MVHYRSTAIQQFLQLLALSIVGQPASQLEHLPVVREHSGVQHVGLRSWPAARAKLRTLFGVRYVHRQPALPQLAHC